MPAIILLRHGQASYGTHDYDRLSPVGFQQADLVPAALAERGVTVGRVVSGTLRRQRETAQPFAGTGVEFLTDERLNEYRSDWVLGHHSDRNVAEEDTGDGREVLSSRDFQAVIDEAIVAWVGAGEDSPAEETHPAFKARALAAVADATAGLPKGSTVVLVTSAGVIGAICAAAGGLPDASMITFNRISINASLTKLISGGTGLTMVSFNEHEHVDRAGLLTYR